MWKPFILLLGLVCCFSLMVDSKERKPRISSMGIFSIISWPNDECEAQWEDKGFGKTTINGTCFTRSECIARGGRPSGSCANGYGICCVFQYSCGNISKANISHFVSPTWPEHFQEPVSCTLKVNKVNDDVCQIRLNFLEFDIMGPITDPISFANHPAAAHSPAIFGSINRQSNCKDDLFVVTHGNRNQPIPLICGNNSGHHIFIPVDETTSDGVSLTFLTGIVERKRRWKIKITQLGCSQPELLAPRGCLQYYTEPKDQIKSFNFEGHHYLQNLDYAICIKRPKDMCFLTLGRSEPTKGAPTVNEAYGTSAAAGNGTAPEALRSQSRREPVARSQVSNRARPRGSLSINGTLLEAQSIVVHDSCKDAGYYITWPGSNRICSEDIGRLRAPVTIAANAPQIIYFRSNPWDDPKTVVDEARPGFAFNYSHSPCTHGFF